MLTSPSGKSYIGQTTRSIEKRLAEHPVKSGCVAISNAIQKYGWENFEKDWYECPDEDLDFDEELLICELGTLSPGGYNLKEGGGSSGKHSIETIQKLIQSHIGKTHTEETKQKISKSLQGEKNHFYGKTHTNESKQKNRESHLGENSPLFGKPRSMYTKMKISKSTQGEKHHSSKRVYQYDLNDNLVCSFGSCGEAARSLGKKRGTNITACARGNQNYKTPYGFKWSYVEL